MLILKATHVHNIQWNLIIMATFGMGPKAHEWQVDCISFPYFSNCYRNNLGLFRADLYCKVAVSGVTTHLVLLSLKQVVSILDILNVLSRLSLQFPVITSTRMRGTCTYDTSVSSGTSGSEFI